jgi:hypothetical protein
LAGLGLSITVTRHLLRCVPGYSQSRLRRFEHRQTGRILTSAAGRATKSLLFSRPLRDLGLYHRFPALASLRAGLFSFAPSAL